MLVSLQALRALAAWLVVFHHFMQVFFDFRTNSLAGHLLATRGQVGVDIFFVLSGFVIHLSSAGRRIPVSTFLVNRVARIAPAYWLYTALTALILLSFSPLMPGYGLALPELVLSLLVLPSQNPAGFGYYPILPVGWTLNFEMMFYLLFALSFLAPPRWRLGLLAVLVVLLNTLLTQTPFFSDFYRNPIIFEFLFGVLLAEAHRRGGLRWPAGVALPLALGAVATLLAFPADHPARLLAWGLPCAVLVAACVALEPWFAGRRLLKALGDWSYSVYLLHVIVLWLGAYWLHQRLGLDPYQTLALCLPAILLLSWLSFEWIEVRGGRRIKALYARWAQPAAA